MKVAGNMRFHLQCNKLKEIHSKMNTNYKKESGPRYWDHSMPLEHHSHWNFRKDNDYLHGMLVAFLETSLSSQKKVLGALPIHAVIQTHATRNASSTCLIEESSNVYSIWVIAGCIVSILIKQWPNNKNASWIPSQLRQLYHNPCHCNLGHRHRMW